MCTILIADDDPNILQGLRQILLDHLPWPHSILEASDGRQALEILCSVPVDLVIADIKMPSVDGLALLHEVKRLLLPCEVLILSSYDDYSFIRDALKMEAFDYLLKPVNIRMLLLVLERMREKLRTQKRPSPSVHALSEEPLPTAPLVSITFYDLSTGTAQQHASDPSQCLKDALFSAAALEKEQTLAHLNAFFGAISAQRPSPDEVRAALMQWTYDLMKANEDYIEMIGSSKLTPDDLLSCIKNLPTISQLHARSAQIISRYIERLQLRAQQKSSHTIKKVLDIIEQIPLEELSLNSIAQRLYMTPNALSALFKEETGTSFRAYRIASVMRRAKELLVQTELSIAHIAETLGYQDVSHFNRAFKKETGMTPGKYRDIHPFSPNSGAHARRSS